MRPVRLRCEHREDAPCIDTPAPRLSWALESDRRGTRQTAYERLRAGIVAAFNREHVGDDAYLEGDTQTAYLLALHMDLLPAERRERAAERLVDNIERHDFHLTTGFVGVGLLCPTLSAMGHSD